MSALKLSVGDFIDAIELIVKFSNALRRSTGAVSQYQQAIIELELLEEVLRAVHNLKCTPDNASTVHRIQVCANTCHVPLARFVAEIEKFEPRLGRVHEPTRSITDQLLCGGRKVQWVVVVESELAKLKAQIGPLLSVIGILLRLATEKDASTYQELAVESLTLI